MSADQAVPARCPELTPADIEAARRIADVAPPLTGEQKDMLRRTFGPATRRLTRRRAEADNPAA